jgi:hypothetical protein
MSVDVLHPGDLDRFERDYYRPNRPAILRGLGAGRGLKVFDQWSAEYFLSVLGDRPVPVIATESAFLSYERDVQQMPYREFVERSFGGQRNGTRYYFKNSTRLLPEGHDDSERLETLAPYLRRAVMRNLWISGPGLTVGLHFDAAENLNFQLRGEKVFSLYPPGTRAYYPMPMFSETAHISRVFREGPHPDLARFPAFDPSLVERVEIRQGDVLYLPAYWWHQVESLGEQNVNLNFWWVPAARKQLLHWNQALRGYVQLLTRLMRHGSVSKAAPRR